MIKTLLQVLDLYVFPMFKYLSRYCAEIYRAQYGAAMLVYLRFMLGKRFFFLTPQPLAGRLLCGKRFIYLFIYLFICLFIYLFIYLFVYLFICLFIYSFNCAAVGLAVYAPQVVHFFLTPQP